MRKGSLRERREEMSEILEMLGAACELKIKFNHCRVLVPSEVLKGGRTQLVPNCYFSDAQIKAQREV